jgi:hypothetical protein
MKDDPRFGRMANVNVADVLTGPPLAGPVPVPARPHDPTVGEQIRDHIAEMQAQIKVLETRYFEARQLGILDVKARTVRDILGW